MNRSDAIKILADQVELVRSDGWHEVADAIKIIIAPPVPLTDTQINAMAKRYHEIADRELWLVGSEDTRTIEEVHLCIMRQFASEFPQMFTQRTEGVGVR